jgi:prepilin-type N-terminal cleavage/methylation domain-containing protein
VKNKNNLITERGFMPIFFKNNFCRARIDCFLRARLKIILPSKQVSGFTLIETMVVVAIFLILLLGSTTLYTDTVNTSTILTGNLNAQIDVRKAFNSMTADIRSASPSAGGAYAIDTASSSYFAFYSDINNDGLT